MTFRIYLDENNKPQIEEVDPPPKPERVNKGKSLLEALSAYTVIDLETTGLDPQRDCIIEVAALRVVDNAIVEQFQSLVNPGIVYAEFGIPNFITELTGITNEMLMTAPLASEILPKFFEFVGGDTVVAHNANFDVNFLYDCCTERQYADFTNDFVDTMRVSRRLYKEHRQHRLIDLVERFKISDNVEHRALSDAIKTQQCYEHMKRFAADSDIHFSSLYPQAGRYKFSAKDITTRNMDFNEDTPIFDKIFAFTGVLEKMPRKEAMQLVVDLGGLCGDGVTQKTNYLVLGNNDYNKSIKDGKSSKHKKAEKLKMSGLDIEVISENVFYDMLTDSIQLINQSDFSGGAAVDIDGIAEKRRDAPVEASKPTPTPPTPSSDTTSHIANLQLEERRLLGRAETTQTIIDLHFCYLGLLGTAYHYIEDSHYANMCIEYCKRDMELFPKFRDAWIKKSSGWGGEPRIPFIPSFQTLVKVYEKQGNYEDAIKVCEAALSYGVHDTTKGGYEGRIEKLTRKLEKQRGGKAK